MNAALSLAVLAISILQTTPLGSACMPIPSRTNPEKQDRVEQLLDRYRALLQLKNRENLDYEQVERILAEISKELTGVCRQDKKAIERVVRELEVTVEKLVATDAAQKPHEFSGDLVLPLIDVLSSVPLEDIRSYVPRLVKLVKEEGKMSELELNSPGTYLLSDLLLPLDGPDGSIYEELKKVKEGHVRKMLARALYRSGDESSWDKELVVGNRRVTYGQICFERCLDLFLTDPCYSIQSYLFYFFESYPRHFDDPKYMHYFEKHLSSEDYRVRQAMAIILLQKYDPKHQRALQTLLTDLYGNDPKAADNATHWIFHEGDRLWHEKRDTLPSIWDRNYAPFLRHLDQAEASKIIRVLSKRLQEGEQRDEKYLLTLEADDQMCVIGMMLSLHPCLGKEYKELLPYFVSILKKGIEWLRLEFHWRIRGLLYSIEFVISSMTAISDEVVDTLIALARQHKDDPQYLYEVTNIFRGMRSAAKKALPFLIEEFRSTKNPEMKAVIFGAIAEISMSK